MRILPRHRRTLRFVALFLLACITLLTAAPAIADAPNGPQFMAMGVAFLFMFVVFVVFWIYWALATQTIAKKTNTENGWLAWIPIANLILWANIARKPIWWGIIMHRAPRRHRVYDPPVDGNRRSP